MDTVNNIPDNNKPLAKRGFIAIPAFLRNKYLLAILVFTIILLFFDKNDVFTQIDRKKELHRLHQSKEHYTQEVEGLKKIRQGLENDPNALEKLSREKYLMKRDNEDVFIIQ